MREVGKGVLEPRSAAFLYCLSRSMAVQYMVFCRVHGRPVHGFRHIPDPCWVFHHALGQEYSCSGARIFLIFTGYFNMLLNRNISDPSAGIAPCCVVSQGHLRRGEKGLDRNIPDFSCYFIMVFPESSDC